MPSPFHIDRPEASTSARARKNAAVTAFFSAVLLLPAFPAAFAQALPAAEAAPISTGFALPTLAGSLRYAVSASESLSWGYYGNSGTGANTNLTGDLAYISSSRRDPFSIIASGGHSWANQNAPSYSFASLGLSQVIAVGRWGFVLGDTVSYLPATAISGLSGVPGVGDLGLNPPQVGVDTGQGVLTNYSTQVDNTAAGSVSRQLTGKTSFNASGAYAVLRFVGDDGNTQQGLDSSATTGSGGMTHRIDARNSFGGNYAYSQFSYSAGNLNLGAAGFVSQTPSAMYIHKFTRNLSMSASAGPEWTTINTPGGSTSISLFADASLNYAGQYSHATLIYVRGTNEGYGVVGGALSDSVSAMAGRTFARVWNCGATTSYSRTENLPALESASVLFDTVVVGGQVSRAIARNLSAFASYTLEHQSVSGSAATVDVYSGLSQIAGFGLTYSPAAMHMGHQ